MKRNLLLLFVLCFYTLTQAQTQPVFTGTKSKKAEKLFGEALQAYTRMDYRAAFDILKKTTDEDPQYIDAWMLLADIREQNEQYQEALTVYRKIMVLKPEFQIPYYKLAKTALDYGEYDTAAFYINEYTSRNGTQIEKSKVTYIQQTSAFGLDAIKHPVPFNPINMGSGVNSMLDEYFPGVTADGQTLIYTRLMRNITEDFFISQRENSQNWSPSKNMGDPINTEQNEGTISISSDGQYVFFTGCNRMDGAGSCDIYFSALDGYDWKTPRNLGFPVNRDSWDSQPSISFDGKTLYFTSNRPGGFGGMDLWVSHYNKGKWSVPQNLGPEINTEGDEQCPFIAKDNQTLYFNSNKRIGMGGVDLFMTRKQPDGRWGKAENLGYPINTMEDEICIVLDASGKMAYYVSGKPGGEGGLDLYEFELYEKARPLYTGYLKGIVLDANTQQKLSAKIELIDLSNGKTIIEVNSNRITGKFLVCLQGEKDYALNVSKQGYLFYSENFALKNQSATDPLVMQVPLQPIEVGNKVVLKNIFFDTDKFELKAESKIELDKLIGFIKANPNLVVEVSGHTDNTGSKQKNTDLSLNRAKAVVDYLTQNGIEAKKLTAKGYADSQPIADNKTEAGRKQNRRTEFKIISK